MSEDSRRRAEEIFQDAADLPPHERDAFVDQACGENQSLREEVHSLLGHLEQAGDEFLARPAFDPSLSTEFEIPRRIGHYRIVDRIGEGGMGVVFEAEQDSPRRRVALKVIRPGLHGPDVRRRFEYEAEILARLQHPSIAHVYEAGVLEVGREEGIAIPLPYFAMELVRGPSIDRWVRERNAPVTRIVEMMAVVAEAVEAAHQRGVIHRDLKPANVVVDEEGRPKVLDFGLARAVDAGQRRSLHTGAGTILGTMPYVSPEQLSGDPHAVDTRTDVYSLGVLLLELLMGKPPVDVGHLPLPEAIRRLREEPLPRPSRRDRRVDPDLETIVQRATDRERSRRYASAGALAEDLHRYLRGEPIAARRDSGWHQARVQIRRHRKAFAAAVSVLVVLLVAAVAGFSLYVRANVARQDANEQLWRAQLQQARAARESETVERRSQGLNALAAAARLRPDRALRDEAIACMALDDLVLERDVPYDAALASTRGLAFIDRYAEAGEDGRITVRALADGATLGEIPAPEEGPLPVVWISFDPSGRLLAVRHYDGPARLNLWQIDPPRRLLSLDDTEHTGRCFDFVRGPEGQDWLAVALEPGGLRLYDLASGETLAERDSPARPVRVAADADGRRFAVSFHTTDTVEIYAVDQLTLLESLQNEVSAYSLTFAAGKRLVAGGTDHLVRVFTPGDDQPRFVLRGHQSAVVEAGAVTGSNVVVTGSWDQTVRFWDCERGREIFSPVTSVYFNAVGDKVVLNSPWHRLQIWRYHASAEFISLVADSDFAAPGNGQLFDRGARAVTSGANGVLEWDVDAGRLRRVLSPLRALDVAVDPSRRRALATTFEGVLELDLRDTDPVRSRILVAEAGFEGIERYPEGWIAAGRESVITFDDGGIRRRLPHPDGSNTVAVSPDGRWLFVGTWHGEPAQVIDNATFRAVRQFPGPHIRGSFDPKGRWLAVVDGEVVLVLALETWEEVFRTPRGFPGNGLAGPVLFSPDGTLMATTLDQYRLELFATQPFASIATLANPDFTTVSKFDFSEDGQRLLVVGTGSRAHVWDLGRVREQLRTLGLDWDREINPRASR